MCKISDKIFKKILAIKCNLLNNKLSEIFIDFKQNL